MTPTQFFRANVGVCVLNAESEILAFERFGFPGTWQLPQGGLDEGEEPLDAARRELKEETGLDWNQQVELVGEHPSWLAYELDADMRKRKPDIGRGQVQKWFVVRLIDSGAKIDLTQIDERKGTQEFSAYAWMNLSDLLSKAAPFRLAVYKPLAEYISSLTGS